MAEVKITETPAAQMIAEAARPVTITDAKGRQITLTKPGILQQFRMVKLVGGEAATNPVYMSMILPLCYVSKIDEDPVFFPKDEKELEALIARLDEVGCIAVQSGVNKHFDEAKVEEVKAEAGE